MTRMCSVPAIKLMEWHQRAAVAFLDKLAPTRFVKDLNRIVEIIHRHGEGGAKPVARRTIVQYAKLPPRDLDDVLTSLMQAGRIRSERGPRGGAAYVESVDQC